MFYLTLPQCACLQQHLPLRYTLAPTYTPTISSSSSSVPTLPQLPILPLNCRLFSAFSTLIALKSSARSLFFPGLASITQRLLCGLYKSTVQFELQIQNMICDAYEEHSRSEDIMGMIALFEKKFLLEKSKNDYHEMQEFLLNNANKNNSVNVRLQYYEKQKTSQGQNKEKRRILDRELARRIREAEEGRKKVVSQLILKFQGKMVDRVDQLSPKTKIAIDLYLK